MPSFIEKLKRKPGSHLGIDIGSHLLKVVELRTTAAGTELVGSGVATISPGSGEIHTVAVQLRRLLREQGIKTKQAVVGVRGPGVAVRRLTMPAVPEKEIPGAIRWQPQKSFPFPMEDALVAFQVLSTGSSEGQATLELLVVAATRKAVMEKVAVLREAGLTCLGVMGEPHAWSAIWEHAGLAEERAQAVVDLGGSKTDIHIFQDGVLQFSRQFSTSGKTLTEALSGIIGAGERQVELELAQAEALKHEYGIPAEGDPSTTSEGIPLSSLGLKMRPVLEKLETEISRSLDYYRYQHEGAPMGRLLLSGGGSQLKGIQTNFAEWFDMEVEFLDPLAPLLGEGGAAVLEPVPTIRPFLAVATGLALPLNPQLNLLPADIRQDRKRNISAKVAYAALGLILLAPLAQYVWQAEQRIDGVRQAAAAKKNQLARYQDLLNEYEGLVQKKIQLDGQLARLPDIDTDEILVSEAMKVVSQEIPDNVALTEMELRAGQEEGFPRLWLKGLIFGPDSDAFSVLSRFMEQLERSPVFNEIEVGSVGESEVPRPAILGFEIVCVFQPVSS